MFHQRKNENKRLLDDSTQDDSNPQMLLYMPIRSHRRFDLWFCMRYIHPILYTIISNWTIKQENSYLLTVNIFVCLSMLNSKPNIRLTMLMYASIHKYIQKVLYI